MGILTNDIDFLVYVLDALLDLFLYVGAACYQSVVLADGMYLQVLLALLKHCTCIPCMLGPRFDGGLNQ